MKRRLPFCILFLAAFAAQAQRVVVIPSPNKAAAPVNEQIRSLLCEQTSAECISPQKVMTQKKLDWDKVKKQRIRWIVTTQYKVTPAQQGKPAQRKVTVLAQNASTQKVQIRPTYALTSAHALSTRNQARLSETLLTTLKLKPALPEEDFAESVAQYVPPPLASSESTPPTLDLSFEDAPPEETTTATLFFEELMPPEEVGVPRKAKPARLQEAEPKKRLYPIASIEVGALLFNHRNAFSQMSTNNLRSFRAGLQSAPALSAEFYPLAFANAGLYSGIGLDANVALSFGFKLQDELGNKFPMKWSFVDGGLRWRMQFSQAWKAAVVPMFGIQHTRLSHGALEDGTSLQGFPQLSLTALRAGLGFELPVLADGMVFVGSFSYLPVLSAKEILEAPYFPEGSAYGLEGKLGLRVKIWGPLSARLLGFWSRTNFKLNAPPNSVYIAETSFYQRFGAQIGIAASF